MMGMAPETSRTSPSREFAPEMRFAHGDAEQAESEHDAGGMPDRESSRVPNDARGGLTLMSAATRCSTMASAVGKRPASHSSVGSAPVSAYYHEALVLHTDRGAELFDTTELRPVGEDEPQIWSRRWPQDWTRFQPVWSA